MPARIGKQAVVVGAGMAGLAAARSLADFFERVIVLENDALPKQATYRPGTPQSRHLHGLLAGGLQALSRLFPGFEDSLSQAGAVRLRMGYDARLERPGYDPFPQRDVGVLIFSMTRPLLEFTVRKRLGEYSNIQLRESCSAQEFVPASDHAAVAGVRCQNSDGGSETLAADFVIDASGHGNLTLTLLHAIGLPVPEETSIGVDMGYATALFDIPEDAPDWKGAATFPHYPHNKRAALILPVEGNRWILTLGGRYDEKPPGDWDGFLTFARHLRTPTVHNAIRRAKPPSEITRFGFKASCWRHFERLEKFPRALLPFGDAICRFNPIYGQGMSVAALEADVLNGLLRAQSAESDGYEKLAREFFAEAEKLIETPWSAAAIPDFIDPRTEGQRPADFEDTLKFFAALLKLAAQDPAVHKLFVEVQSLLKPRSAYRDPDLVRRIKAIMAEAAQAEGSARSASS
jgi:2-polyprenyl-6-methoxyphenol hydroxylase-like FAD-dependent oxidoreductase